MHVKQAVTSLRRQLSCYYRTPPLSRSPMHPIIRFICRAIHSILKQHGVTRFEPGVVDQLVDFASGYAGELLGECERTRRFVQAPHVD